MIKLCTKVGDFSRGAYIGNTEKLLVWEEKVLVVFEWRTAEEIYFWKDVFMMVFVN